MVVPTCHSSYPPFDPSVETAPLVSIKLADLEAGKPETSAAFWEAAQGLGFFYMDMFDSALGEKVVQGAEQLHALQQKVFALPNKEKDEYRREVVDPFFAYRPAELKVMEKDGVTPKRTESWNIRKDDIVGNCERLPIHPLILEAQPILLEYTRNCRAIIDLMITHLEQHLELPLGTIANLHRIHELSGDHVRFTQSAPQPFSEEAARAREHTDFGTLTILFNWLGGLQIRRPSDDKWVYVKPIPGSAVVNLGDALVKFTAGILRSNVHRVVPPPGEQAELPRNSLVYFSRPENKVIFRRLKGGIIDKQPAADTFGDGLTAAEWIARRSYGDLKGVYTAKGLESRNMEDVKAVYLTPKVPIATA